MDTTFRKFRLRPVQAISLEINTGDIDVFDFLIEKPLRESYLPDAFLQLVEIVHRGAGLETLVIEGKTLNNVFFKTLGGPDTELGALRGYRRWGIAWSKVDW